MVMILWTMKLSTTEVQHKHKQKNGIVVKEYESSKPDNNEGNFLINDTKKVCRRSYFHSFDNRAVYDTKIINTEKNEEINLTDTPGHMK